MIIVQDKQHKIEQKCLKKVIYIHRQAINYKKVCFSQLEKKLYLYNL